MFEVLLLDVVKNRSEDGWVVHNDFIDDGSVDVLRREFVGIALLYHLGHFGKVLADGQCILVDNHIVVLIDVLDEYRVVRQVL